MSKTVDLSTPTLSTQSKSVNVNSVFKIIILLTLAFSLYNYISNPNTFTITSSRDILNILQNAPDVNIPTITYNKNIPILNVIGFIFIIPVNATINITSMILNVISWIGYFTAILFV